MIHRVVLNEWKYVEYYVQETLDYCKKSRILTEEEIKQLKVTRVEGLKKEMAERGGVTYMKSNSYSQNLTEAILADKKPFVWLMRLFHREYLDI